MIKQLNYYRGKKRFDRRQMQRFRVNANCSYHSLNPTLYYEDYNICKIEDISLGGMSILSENVSDLNERLYFTIAIRDSITEEPITAVGDVKWISQRGLSSYKYRVGIRFVKILQDDLMNLSHHFN